MKGAARAAVAADDPVQPVELFPLGLVAAELAAPAEGIVQQMHHLRRQPRGIDRGCARGDRTCGADHKLAKTRIELAEFVEWLQCVTRQDVLRGIRQVPQAAPDRRLEILHRDADRRTVHPDPSDRIIEGPVIHGASGLRLGDDKGLDVDGAGAVHRAQLREDLLHDVVISRCMGGLGPHAQQAEQVDQCIHHFARQPVRAGRTERGPEELNLQPSLGVRRADDDVDQRLAQCTLVDVGRGLQTVARRGNECVGIGATGCHPRDHVGLQPIGRRRVEGTIRGRVGLRRRWRCCRRRARFGRQHVGRGCRLRGGDRACGGKGLSQRHEAVRVILGARHFQQARVGGLDVRLRRRPPVQTQQREGISRRHRTRPGRAGPS